MREELQALKEQALAELGAVTTPDELKDLRIKYLGKKGPMTEILRGMGALPAEERPKIGQIVNEVKSALETAINAKTEVLEAESLKARLANEKVDFAWTHTKLRASASGDTDTARDQKDFYADGV